MSEELFKTDGIDACVVWPQNRAYFFKGGNYLRFDIGADRVVQAPAPILGAWPGWPESWAGGIQGAIAVDSQRAYFFRGGEYLRYNIAEDRVDQSPRPIAAYWPGWPASWNDGIDGCVHWGNGLVYFFRGANYIRYDLNLDRVTRDPTPIASAWGNWPSGWSGQKINGGGVWPGGTAYLFSGDRYIRYGVAADAALSSPAPIFDNWIGWPGYDLTKVRQGNYTIKSKAHDRYLCREAEHYIVNRTSAGAWETFTFTPDGGGWHIQDYHGHYLRLEYTWLLQAGDLPGIKPTLKVEDASSFQIDPVTGGGHSIQVHNAAHDATYYLSAEESGALALKGTQKSWETFILTRPS